MVEGRGSGGYPEGERGAVFGELESHKAVDEETPARSSGESTLRSYKVGKDNRRERDDASVENERHDRKSRIEVEKGDNLFPSDGGVLGSHGEYHDDRHNECGDVDETRCSLEDEGVCEFDVAGIADGLDAGRCSDEGTQRQRCLLADVVKGAESHGGGGGERVLERVLLLTGSRDVRVLQLAGRGDPWRQQ